MSAKRILIVEDNPLNMELFRDLLVAQGYHVMEAGDAEECQERLRLEVPDLILLDIQLPGMDGYTLARTLRSEPAYAGVPIVALTAYAMRGDREKVLAAGCNGFISKPINMAEFLKTVSGYLEDC